MTNGPINPGVRIGHVHLKVADLDRALNFYCGVLGFELMQRLRGAAFISAGGYHHHIGLNTWESAGGSPPPPGSTGLYHVAILYPARAQLADALRRLIAADIPLEGNPAAIPGRSGNNSGTRANMPPVPNDRKMPKPTRTATNHCSEPESPATVSPIICKRGACAGTSPT